MSLMVSVSGIRGLVGEDLHPRNIVRYSAAFASWCTKSDSRHPKRIVVGRDGRPSGKVLLDLVKGSLAACGFEVVDLGLCSTPGTAMAVTSQDARGGIVLTASHNPAAWNALKFLDAEGNFLSEEMGREVLALEAAEDFPWQKFDQLGGYRRWRDADRYHIDAILALPFCDSNGIASRAYTVAVDAVNASGSKVLPELLEALGAKVLPLYCEGNGDFPHNPEPKPAHLGDLAKLVREQGADLGLAVDPDADRLVLVDETGKVLSEEFTLALAMDYYLSKTPGPVVANLSSSRMNDDVAARYGQVCERSAVGEAHVVSLMRKTAAVIGGEGNGGVILPELHAGRDGLVGTALILSAMFESGLKISELVARIPSYHMEKRRFETGHRLEKGELEDLLGSTLIGELDLRDGIRADEAEGWIHVRPSNTEAIVRIIGESADPKWLKTKLDAVESILGEHLS
jgi:phosphomannomutase